MKNFRIAGDIIELERLLGEMKQDEVVKVLLSSLEDAIITTMEVADSWADESEENRAMVERIYGDVEIVFGEDYQRSLAVAIDFYDCAVEVFKSILTLFSRHCIDFEFQMQDAEGEKNLKKIHQLICEYVEYYE